MQCFGGAWATSAEEVVGSEVDCGALDMDRVVVCTLVRSAIAPVPLVWDSEIPP
jgi:hypothetical protein